MYTTQAQTANLAGDYSILAAKPYFPSGNTDMDISFCMLPELYKGEVARSMNALRKLAETRSLEATKSAVGEDDTALALIWLTYLQKGIVQTRKYVEAGAELFFPWFYVKQLIRANVLPEPANKQVNSINAFLDVLRQTDVKVSKTEIYFETSRHGSYEMLVPNIRSPEGLYLIVVKPESSEHVLGEIKKKGVELVEVAGNGNKRYFWLDTQKVRIRQLASEFDENVKHFVRSYIPPPSGVTYEEAAAAVAGRLDSAKAEHLGAEIIDTNRYAFYHKNKSKRLYSEGIAKSVTALLGELDKHQKRAVGVALVQGMADEIKRKAANQFSPNLWEVLSDVIAGTEWLCVGGKCAAMLRKDD